MSFLALVALLGLAARVTVGTWLGSRYSTAAREHPEERLALLARARAADPYSPDHCVEHAVALLDGGEPALALAEADAGARRTESVGVELVRAKALSLLGRKPEARAALGRALAYDPASFRANLGLCALELEAGRLEASQAAFDRARRVLPGDSRLEPLERRVRAAFRARELGELNTSP